MLSMLPSLLLQMSDFQHFHWLARHGLSVDIPAVPNNWSRKESAIKRDENLLAALRKNGQQKLEKGLK